LNLIGKNWSLNPESISLLVLQFLILYSLSQSTIVVSLVASYRVQAALQFPYNITVVSRENLITQRQHGTWNSECVPKLFILLYFQTLTEHDSNGCVLLVFPSIFLLLPCFCLLPNLQPGSNPERDPPSLHHVPDPD
jgi:hypothetical protein